MRYPWILLLALGLSTTGCFDEGGAPLTDGSTSASTDTGTTEGTGSSTTEGPTSTTVVDSSGTGPGAGCPAQHLCVPPPAQGWDGPIAIEEAPAVNPASPCPADYPAAAEGAMDGLGAPDADCTCSCGAPENVTCDDATLERWAQGPDPACVIPGNSAPGDCGGSSNNTITVPSSGQCTPPIFGGLGLQGSFVATLPDVSDGACDPESMSQADPATWQTRVTVCGGVTLAESCEGEGICAPVPEAPFSPLLCISRAGDNECPAGPYADKRLRYRDYDDSRDCEACTCGAPSGSCGGTMTLYGQSNCTGNELDIDPIAACTTHGCLVRGAIWQTDPASAACEPSAGAPRGGVEPSDPITLCCFES